MDAGRRGPSRLRRYAKDLIEYTKDNLQHAEKDIEKYTKAHEVPAGASMRETVVPSACLLRTPTWREACRSKAGADACSQSPPPTPFGKD